MKLLRAICISFISNFKPTTSAMGFNLLPDIKQEPDIEFLLVQPRHVEQFGVKRETFRLKLRKLKFKVHKLKYFEILTKCEKCNNFTKHLDSHKKFCHGPELKTCDFCAYKTDSKIGLNNHTKRKKCVFCPIEFKCPRHFENHIVNYHSNKNGDINCPNLDCTQICRTPVALQCHLRNVHVKADFLVCKICSKKLGSRPSLKTHMNYKHANFTKEYQCDLCPYKQVFKKYLRKHIKIHKSEKRSWICDFCGAKLTRKYHLLNHFNQKTSKCLFKCPIRFRCRQLRDRHHKEVHENEQNN